MQYVIWKDRTKSTALGFWNYEIYRFNDEVVDNAPSMTVKLMMRA